MTAFQSSLEQAYPLTNANRGMLVRTLQEEIDQQSGNTAVKIIFGIVSFVLLMACANVANLMMSRATGRRKEMAVRVAIGAGRWRLVRQMMGETLLLFLAGAAWESSSRAGLLRCCCTPSRRGRSLICRTTAVLMWIGRCWRSWRWSPCGCGVLFGLAPALEGTRFDVNRN